jgi:branched-chain amino acid transport system substrate-binding protein
MVTRRKLLKTGTAAGLALSAGGLAAPALASGAKINLKLIASLSTISWHHQEIILKLS